MSAASSESRAARAKAATAKLLAALAKGNAAAAAALTSCEAAKAQAGVPGTLQDTLNTVMGPEPLSALVKDLEPGKYSDPAQEGRTFLKSEKSVTKSTWNRYASEARSRIEVNLGKLTTGINNCVTLAVADHEQTRDELRKQLELLTGQLVEVQNELAQIKDLQAQSSVTTPKALLDARKKFSDCAWGSGPCTEALEPSEEGEVSRSEPESWS